MFDESLVLFALALDLRLGDILYLSAKVSGDIDDLGRPTVRRPPTIKEPADTLRALKSLTFRSKNKEDFDIYRAASAKLSSGIKIVGHVFQRVLLLFKRILALARARCGVNSTTTRLTHARAVS